MKTKKHLGQNFLKSQGAIRSIVSTAKLSSEDLVLEIGPGKGVLTEALLKTGAKIVSVEKDVSLIKVLKEKFAGEIKSGQLTLLGEDILSFDPEKYKLKTGNHKLIANIPYNITGEIFRKFIGGKSKPALAVLLVQKEVAERIVARDGKESILSISIKAYGTPKYIEKVSARYFSPKPKVDSAIISIENIRNPFRSADGEKKFFQIVKTGFAHKRKKLSGNLKTILGKNVLEKLDKCGINKNARAEELRLEKWLYLAEKI